MSTDHLGARWPDRVEVRAVTDLVQVQGENPRRHSESQLELLAASIRSHGWTSPIVIAAETGAIIAGHARLEAARRIGLSEVPVLPLSGLSEAAARALRLADNRIAELGEWDLDQLARELDWLEHSCEIDLGALGWSDEQLDLLDTRESPPPEDPADEEPPRAAAEPDAPAVTRTGDLWRLGEHRLLCGDSTDPAAWQRLGAREAALVHTDPPYGVAYESAAHGQVAGDELTGDALVRLLVGAFRGAIAAAREDAAWYVWHASSTRADFEWALTAVGVQVAQELVWVKPSPNLGWSDYHWQHEPCLYGARAGKRPAFHGGRAQATVWRMAAATDRGLAVSVDGGVVVLDGNGASLHVQQAPIAPRRTRRVRLREGQALDLWPGPSERSTVWAVARETDLVHPTQKPVALVSRALVNSSTPGDLVVDPFGGSGSTLIAAETLGRRAALIELEPRHCDSIVRRWESLTGKRAKRERAKTAS
jgi:DNA modification methylase